MKDPVDVDATKARSFGLADLLEPFEGDWHAHNKLQILYAYAGTMHLEVADEQWFLPPQRAAWIAPALRHRVRATRPVELRTVYIDPEIVPILSRRCAVFGVSPLAREMILHAMRWGPEDTPDPVGRAFFAALAALSCEWVMQASAHSLPVARSEELARAMRFALAHLEEWPSIEDAARAAGLSVRTLSRRFAEETGTTWSDFLSDAKMLRAMELLAIDGARVTQTAFGVGFKSMSAFTKAFTRFAGETPAEYKNRSRP